MRRWVLLVVLAAVLLMPTALALDQEEILQDQSQSLGIEDLEEAGEAYTGQHDIEDGLDVGASFRHMAETGKEALFAAVCSCWRLPCSVGSRKGSRRGREAAAWG